MENNLKIFEHAEFGKVRTMTIKGEPWFVGKDVADVLGYEKSRNAIAKHVDEDDALKWGLMDSLGRIQETTIINESGLYSLILSSKLPAAKEFKRWVTAEILPIIRKTGGYVSNEDLFINTYLPEADDGTKLLFRTTLTTIRSLNNKIEADKPKVLFAEAVNDSGTTISVGDLAKLLNQNGVNIGQNKLFEWLRENKYLCASKGERHNMPTQSSIKRGLFKIKESAIPMPGKPPMIVRSARVTGKGQRFFVEKFLNEGVD